MSKKTDWERLRALATRVAELHLDYRDEVISPRLKCDTYIYQNRSADARATITLDGVVVRIGEDALSISPGYASDQFNARQFCDSVYKILRPYFADKKAIAQRQRKIAKDDAKDRKIADLESTLERIREGLPEVTA